MNKKFLSIFSMGLFLFTMIGIASASNFYESMLDGGNRLVETQNTDGGWDWPLDDGNSATGSALNTIAPIGMGLAQAYLQTGDAAQKVALQTVGEFLLTKTAFSTHDGYLAAQLDNIFGGTTYKNYVKENYYDKLEAGTYERNSIQYDTETYIDFLVSYRAGANANLAAWDIGMGLYSAEAVGVDTSEWMTGTQEGLDAITYGNFYDVVGLAGSLFGLATAESSTDLTTYATKLSGYQIGDGGWTWTDGAMDAAAGDETVQETAYAMMALLAVDSELYSGQARTGANWLMEVQLATGGWKNWSGALSENNEITGEALWAISAAVPEPTTLLLLGFGLLGVAGVSRRKN
ncbi:MAG: PEP-CTERM sorting domain-containing protein [Desulfobacula sp.]|jgi:hypothetical protein|nr:PEP-CTERM sorting domain-containing protein [Desulfobacula sp.]